MADNPLVSFWNDTLKQANADKKKADDNLKSAQTDLDAKRKNLAAAAAALKAQQQNISTIRAQLANISTSEDGDALLDKFRKATLDAHTAQGKLLAAEDDQALAVAKVAQRAAIVGSVATRVANAGAALSEAKQQAAARDALKDAAGKAPLATIKKDANTALASPPFTKAKDRIEADFPAPLIANGEERFQSERSRVTRVQNQKKVVEDLAAVDKIATQKLALSRAVTALQEVVQNGLRNLAQTGTTLANVADKNQAKLTPEQTTSIKGLKQDGTPDDAINKPRGDAATASAKLAQAQRAFDDQQAEVDNARLKARARGVEESKIDADPQVKPAIDALKPLATARDKADQDFDANARKAMTEWAAAVPDANWQLLADYENARSALTLLGSSEAADLVKAVTDAEAALIAALQEAAGTPPLQDLVRQESASRSSLRDAQTDAFLRRAFSAMRSDYF